MNGDGFDDLIIGSPFAASGGLQRGLVGIFYASSVYTGTMVYLWYLGLCIVLMILYINIKEYNKYSMSTVLCQLRLHRYYKYTSPLLTFEALICL